MSSSSATTPSTTPSISNSNSSGVVGSSRLFEDFYGDANQKKTQSSSQDSYKLFAKTCDFRGKTSQLETWAKIQRLKPSCQVYRNILEYVRNSCTGRLQVHKIYRVDRKDERSAFTDPYRIMLWHGTKAHSIPGILEKGLVAGVEGLFGGAVYFADRIAKSQEYALPTLKGRLLFILAEVSPGKVYKANNCHEEYSTAPQGFDSVKGTGSTTPDWKENKQLYGAIFPCGKSMEATRHQQYSRNFNEYVIYSPDRVIVRYIVECKHSSSGGL